MKHILINLMVKDDIEKKSQLEKKKLELTELIGQTH